MQNTSAALQDLCVEGREADVGLVDLLLCVNQETTSFAGDGGCGGAWGAAAPFCPGRGDPFSFTRWVELGSSTP